MSLELVPLEPPQWAINGGPVFLDNLNKPQKRDLFKFIAENYLAFEFSPRTYKCGVICISGWAELFDLRDTPAFTRISTERIDVLALFFWNNVTFPTSLKGNATRAFTAAGTIQKATRLSQTPILMRNFITGIEHQLLRRVIAIGTETMLVEEKDGLLAVGEEAPIVATKVLHSLGTKWIVVPKTQKERHEPPTLTDLPDIEELVRWLWTTFEQTATPIPDTIERQGAQLRAVLIESGLFTVEPNLMLRAVSRIVELKKQNRGATPEPDFATLERLIPGFRRP